MAQGTVSQRETHLNNCNPLDVCGCDNGVTPEPWLTPQPDGGGVFPGDGCRAARQQQPSERRYAGSALLRLSTDTNETVWRSLPLGTQEGQFWASVTERTLLSDSYHSKRQTKHTGDILIDTTWQPSEERSTNKKTSGFHCFNILCALTKQRIIL